MKPKNPYALLKLSAQEFVRKCLTRRTVTCMLFKKENVESGAGYDMRDLSQRVQAAQQLGWDVRVRWTDAGLQVEYVEKMPGAPEWYL